MLVTEELVGPQLITRHAELKALGVLFVGLKVGDRPSKWELSYHTQEQRLEQPDLLTNSPKGHTGCTATR